MSDIRPDHRYTDDHEWARTDDDGNLVVGITDYAQSQLGDVVMVELPEVGTELDKGDVFGVVESPKSVSDLFAPIAGTIVAVNEALEDEPEAINADPYGKGWIATLKPADAGAFATLMDNEAYAAHLAADDH